MQSSQLREIQEALEFASLDEELIGKEKREEAMAKAKLLARALFDVRTKQDSETFPNGMLFEAALYAIKAGRRLTRASWEDKNMQIALHVPPLMIGDEKMTEPYLYLKVGDYATPWCPGQGDLMANDWMLVR